MDIESSAPQTEPTVAPIMANYAEPGDFVRDRLRYLKASDKSFSVLRECKSLRRVSPALVSLIVKNKRKVTVDRTAELARLMRLNFGEKTYFRDWIERLDLKNAPTDQTDQTDSAPSPPHVRSSESKRKAVGTHLLSDWLNVYVKDCFQLAAVQQDKQEVYAALAGVASPKRIDKAIQFLRREGYLRETLNGKFVLDTPLVTSETPTPSAKVRKFHKSALKIAYRALDLYGTKERLANTTTLPLTEQSYQELLQIIAEFSEKLQAFAENQQDDGDRLYQITLHLSPTGGKPK